MSALINNKTSLKQIKIVSSYDRFAHCYTIGKSRKNALMRPTSERIARSKLHRDHDRVSPSRAELIITTRPTIYRRSETRADSRSGP